MRKRDDRTSVTLKLPINQHHRMFLRNYVGTYATTEWVRKDEKTADRKSIKSEKK